MALVHYNNVVEERLYVVDLVGGDNHGAVVGHVFRHDLAEECLRGYVQSVGGLVQQQQTAAGSESHAHRYLLPLSHGEGMEVADVVGQAELGKALVEGVIIEVGIEPSENVPVALQRDAGQHVFFRHEEYVTEHLWVPVEAPHAVDGYL